ncbi:hypothetical protein QTO34_014223 [Cnephaeus nilssonii]|uniref:Phospholipid scramblase n=1 Tax=Cnephaeus nilssonii TaxID=3371016 RepID=A0AA40I6Y6_CNENI|nr:hypothetical protein QTO34_014223 [Eptesicus nilssonii]
MAVKLILTLLEKAKCFIVGEEDAVTILSDKWWSWFFGGGRCLERRTECTLKVKGSSNSSRRRACLIAPNHLCLSPHCHSCIRKDIQNDVWKLDLIVVHQQVELLGMILGTETVNKYEIKNSLGQRIYFAVEESICFNRTFCSTLRSCTLRITDNSGREVITVNRPLRCDSCWCPCYLQELEIQAPPGTIVGYVAQKWDPFLPKFTIQNANKEDILKIVGPCATCGCFGDVDFEV